jgi:hypothetical protein
MLCMVYLTKEPSGKFPLYWLDQGKDYELKEIYILRRLRL